MELAERLGNDLYILPSSIHEVLLLPVSMGTPEELAGILTAVLALLSKDGEEE